MENKYLPIKIFQRRERVDDRLVEGGGNSMPPKWVLSAQELVTKSEGLLDELLVVDQTITTKLQKYSTVPAVLKAKLSDEALAKSHRSDLAKFLYADQPDRVIGFSDDQSLLIRVDNRSQLADINNNIKDYANHAKAISGVERIDVFKPTFQLPEDRTSPREREMVLKVKLQNFSNPAINNRALEAFKALLASTEGLKFVKTVKYTDALEVHRIVADSLDSLRQIEDFSAILSVETMPTVDMTTDEFMTDDPIPLPAPVADVDYPIVGVLDSGIADIPQLQPWILGKRHTNYPDHFLDPSHGTFVSGIIGFGDALEGASYTGVNGCRMFDAAVMPNPNMESVMEDDLVDNIGEVVETHKDRIKIWNLSLGSKLETSIADFSDFAVALDNIQDKNDVLIIKSAGNCRNYLSSLPQSRIARGADSVRALTVGSIAHSQQDTDFAPINMVSPFSRVGPGPGSIVKPDLIHYGGNSGVDANGTRVDNGVRSFHIDGRIKRSVGTSFSTPRVSAIAADLESKVGESFDPLLIKALIIHSCRYPDEAQRLPIIDRLYQLGFGLPRTADDTLYNDKHEITLILRDTLAKGEFAEILDFPYPESLVDENGYYTGQITVTLVSKPFLVEGQASEYCQSNVEVAFGTYDNKSQRDITKRTIRNPIGRVNSHNLLLLNMYSKKSMSDGERPVGWNERMLVQYGDKFYPNKKYAIDLSELTPGNRNKSLTNPKNWYLKITGLYRNYIEASERFADRNLSQEYCVVVTIRDPLRRAPVYDEVTALLQANNFIHRDIKLKQQINIQVRDN